MMYTPSLPISPPTEWIPLQMYAENVLTIFERGLVRVDEAVRNARLDAVDSELGARVFNGDNGSMMGGSVYCKCNYSDQTSNENYILQHHLGFLPHHNPILPSSATTLPRAAILQA